MRFVCWLFRGNDFDRNKVIRYGAAHVNALSDMLWDNGRHELTCIADSPGWQISGRVRCIQMPREIYSLPKYYPKLWAFSKECGSLIGEKFASIDLDVIVLDDLGKLFDGSDFRIWDDAKGEPYNSSFFILEPGSRSIVWDSFSIEGARLAESRASRWTGDQSWIAHVLGANERTYSSADGLLRFRPGIHRKAIPENTKAVFFCGPYDPLHEDLGWRKKAIAA